jgi:hypothetical protein
LSAWFGIVLLFVLFGVIVLAIIGPSPRRSDYEETRAKKRVENLKTLREEADKALTTYAWSTKTKASLAFRFERAMELTVAELAKQKPAPGRSDRYARGASNRKRSSECDFPGTCYVSETQRRTRHHLKRLRLLHLKERRPLVRSLHRQPRHRHLRPLPRRQLHQAPAKSP